MSRQVDVMEFGEILPLICKKDTSADPKHWSTKKPLWGHCAVVALLAQNIFGGQLLRASLEGTAFEQMRSHYWNRLRENLTIDFTAPQFGKNYPKGLKEEIRERDYLLLHSETLKRYKLLAWRFIKHIYDGNPLLEDPVYQECIMAALESDCAKMQFGCVIATNHEIVARSCNRKHKSLKHLCTPKCIRLSTMSRTEQMLGACMHAEELAMAEVIKKGIALKDCDLFIAGLENGLPWIKTTAEHTCLRCSLQMENYGIGMIYVPVRDRWESVASEKAVKTALGYATGEQKA